MALKVDIPTTPIGIAVTGAYARIARFHGDKGQVLLDVEIYASAEARAGNARPIVQMTYSVDKAGTVKPATPLAPLEAFYDALKTGSAMNVATNAASDFADAVDC